MSPVYFCFVLKNSAIQWVRWSTARTAFHKSRQLITGFEEGETRRAHPSHSGRLAVSRRECTAYIICMQFDKMSDFTWSNENVIKLIELFKEKQVLWNTQMDEYKDRIKKHDAWMQIAAEFNLDKKSVEKKMRSLIGQFQRESKRVKKKRRREEEEGAGADDIPKWFAYQKLLFLRDRNKPEETVDGGLSVNETQSGTQNSDTSTDSDINEFKTFTVPKTFRKRLRPQVTEDKTSEEAFNLLKDMYESRRHRDENDIFGEYVASKLKEIKNTYARNTAQYQIHNILFNASMGEYYSD